MMMMMTTTLVKVMVTTIDYTDDRDDNDKNASQAVPETWLRDLAAVTSPLTT